MFSTALRQIRMEVTEEMLNYTGVSEEENKPVLKLELYSWKLSPTRMSGKYFKNI